MRVHLINPSNVSFGVAVITPRWLYVLAAATGTTWGDPNIVDETLEHIDPDADRQGDVVGIGIHTGNALRGYEVGRPARERGAWVVFGGIHATLFPDEAHENGGAHSVVKGDGDVVWSKVVSDCFAGAARAGLRRRAHCRRPVRIGALGPAADGQLHVGVGADGARLPEALLVLFGLAHGRPGAAAARSRSRSSAKSSSCGVSDSASSRSRTTISIRSRSRTWRRPARRSDPTAAARARGAAAGALRADGAARAAAGGHRVLHADHDGGGGGCRIPRRDEARAHPRRAGRRRSGHRRGIEGRLQGLQPLGRRARRRGCARSASTAFTCSARSSSGCRAIARTPSTRRWRWPSRPTSPSRSSSCSRRSRARSTSRSGRPSREADARTVDGVPITRHWLIPEASRPKLYTPHPTLAAEEIRVRHAGRLGSVLQLAQRLDAFGRRQVARARGSHSCSFRSCIARCTRTPASRPTARAWRGRRGGRSCSARHAGGCSSRRRCRSWRFPRGSPMVRRFRLFRLD